MKALILNSGTGSRLKNKSVCKCLTELAGNVTILDLQISSLLRCGVFEIYITTGPYAGILEKHARSNHPQAEFTFIHNPLYEKTNYIYSMMLASERLRNCELVLLHGDLVFEQNVLQDIPAAGNSMMVTDSAKPLPVRDFKAVVNNGRIEAVGVDLFENAVYAQPLYKLTKQDWDIWGKKIEDYCKRGITDVYAEQALNEVSSRMNIVPYDIAGQICFEVDTDDDLELARDFYRKYHKDEAACKSSGSY